jgi:hypothetical protein
LGVAFYARDQWDEFVSFVAAQGNFITFLHGTSMAL